MRDSPAAIARARWAVAAHERRERLAVTTADEAFQERLVIVPHRARPTNQAQHAPGVSTRHETGSAPRARTTYLEGLGHDLRTGNPTVPLDIPLASTYSHPSGQMYDSMARG